MSRKAPKFGKVLNKVPWLTRRVLIKWWNKFNFFDDSSVYQQKGIIILDKKDKKQKAESSHSKVAFSDLFSLFRDLLDTLPKEEIKTQFLSALASKEESSHVSQSREGIGSSSKSKARGRHDRFDEKDSSDDEMSEEGTPLHDAQDPFEF